MTNFDHSHDRLYKFYNLSNMNIIDVSRAFNKEAWFSVQVFSIDSALACNDNVYETRPFWVTRENAQLN